MECYIIKPAQSLLMKHLVIGQRQKAPDFSAFHWSPRGNLVSIGQHFVITRVVHLPKRTETSLITESVIKLVSDLITKSDQAVQAVHSCNSWLLILRTSIFQAATEALKSGKSVVADNTNPTVVARKDFIDTAKKQG